MHLHENPQEIVARLRGKSERWVEWNESSAVSIAGAFVVAPDFPINSGE